MFRLRVSQSQSTYISSFSGMRAKAKRYASHQEPAAPTVEPLSANAALLCLSSVRPFDPFPRTLLLLPLHKLQRLLSTNHSHTTALVPLITYPVGLFSHKQHLGPKSGTDELTTAASTSLGTAPFATICLGGCLLLLRDLMQHLGDGSAVLGVEVGIDFVEEIERSRVAALDCEDEGQGAEA